MMILAVYHKPANIAMKGKKAARFTAAKPQKAARPAFSSGQANGLKGYYGLFNLRRMEACVGRRGKAHPLTRSGVRKGQRIGVQHQPRGLWQTLGAVDGIAQHRMMDGGHMHANLMRAARNQMHIQQRGTQGLCVPYAE